MVVLKRALSVALLGGLFACHDFDRAFDQCVASGACEPPPGTGALVVEPPELTLRTVIDERVTATFVVRNLGPIALTGLEVGQPEAPVFFSRQTDCGETLAPGERCGGEVSFLHDAGTPLDSLLVVSTLETGSVNVPLRGRVSPRLTANPEAHQFGLVYVDEPVAPLEVTVTNNSAFRATAPLDLDVPSLIVSLFPPIVYPPQYGVDAGTCVGALPPLGQCRLSVYANPTQIEVAALQRLTIQGLADAGALPDELVRIALDMQPERRALLGFNTLLATLELDAGTSITREYGLLNYSDTDVSGPVSLALDDDAGVVSFDAGACLGATLAPRARCDVAVTYAPATGGLFNPSLTATASPGGTAVLRLPLRSIDLVPLVVTVGDGGAVVSDAGIDCPGQCSTLVRRFKRVTLEARPEPGFELERWGGACADAGPTCLVFPDAGLSVEATFRVP